MIGKVSCFDKLLFCCYLQKFQASLSLVFGLIPTFLNTLNMTIQKLWLTKSELTVYSSFDILLSSRHLLWIFQELFSLCDKLPNHSSFGFKLAQRLFLSFNELLNIFNTTWSNISGRAEHDTIQKFNMRFKLISISVTFPIEVNFYLIIRF